LAQCSLGIAASGLTKAAVCAKAVERSIARTSRCTATTLHERVQGSQCVLRRFVEWHGACQGNEGCETEEECLHFEVGGLLLKKSVRYAQWRFDIDIFYFSIDMLSWMLN
jgi:hypothetical protein